MLIHPIPLLLLLIIGLLTALIVWGFWRQVQSQKSNGTSLGFDTGNLQLSFLALAIFTLGVLVTYVLFIFLLR